MKMQKKKAEEEDERRKAEDLMKSKQDVEMFLDKANDVEGDTSAFDEVQQIDVDQNRLDAIDDVFAPMAPGQSADDMELVGGDIPEDPLQKASVQDSLLQQEAPVEEEDHFFDDLVSNIPTKSSDIQRPSQELEHVDMEMKAVEDPYDHFGESEEEIEK